MPRSLRMFALLLLFTLASALPAAAQVSPFRGAGPLGNPITYRSLSKYAGILGLDAEQQALVKQLHKGYRAEFLEATAEAHRRTDEIGEQNPDEERQERMRVAVDFVERIDRLERRLLQDIQALCTPEQSARIEAAERARRRELGTRLALGAGDGIDLPAIFDRLRTGKPEGARTTQPPPPPSTEVQEVLLRWELDIDRLEHDRERLLRDIFQEMVKASDDDAGAYRIIEQLFALSVRSRGITETALRQLGPVLPAEEHSALTAEVKRLTFPRIYDYSDAERGITVALGFGDLAEDQRERIEALRTDYRVKAGPINDRWAAAAHDKQADLPKTFRHHTPSQDPSDPFNAARADRFDLDDSTLARLAEILTEEQRARLPKPRRRDGMLEYFPDLSTAMEENWEEFEGDN